MEESKPASTLNGTVTTYHGHYDPIVMEGFGVPNVPIVVTVHEQGVAIRLGPDSPPDDERAPIPSSIWIERRTDRWSINVESQDGGDIDVGVYILDDGRVEIQDCRNELLETPVEYVDIPSPSLPWDQVKYKNGLPAPQPTSEESSS